MATCLLLRLQISALNMDSIRVPRHGSLREHEDKILFWIRGPQWGCTVERLEGCDIGVAKWRGGSEFCG